MKKIQSRLMALACVTTIGLSSVELSFADSGVNLTNTNNSYLTKSDAYNGSKKDFTETVTIDNQEYVFKHKFSGDLHTIEFQGGNESNTVSFNSKSNEIYVDGKYANTIQDEKELVPDSNMIQTKGVWTKTGTHKFKYKFLGTESKALIASIIATKCTNTKVGNIISGIGFLVGVVGFCSFKETIYFKTNNSNYRKYDLAIYSDRNWSSYEKTITHYGVI